MKKKTFLLNEFLRYTLLESFFNQVHLKHYFYKIALNLYEGPDNHELKKLFSPRIQKAFRINLSRPFHVWYLDRQPALQTRSDNSILSQTTITISLNQFKKNNNRL